MVNPEEVYIRKQGTCSSWCFYYRLKSRTLDGGVSDSSGVHAELHGESGGGGEDAAHLGSQHGLGEMGGKSRQHTPQSVLSHFLNDGSTGKLTGVAKCYLTGVVGSTHVVTYTLTHCLNVLIIINVDICLVSSWGIVR